LWFHFFTLVSVCVRSFRAHEGIFALFNYTLQPFWLLFYRSTIKLPGEGHVSERTEAFGAPFTIPVLASCQEYFTAFYI
jgi:hypothetical protein